VLNDSKLRLLSLGFVLAGSLFYLNLIREQTQVTTTSSVEHSSAGNLTKDSESKKKSPVAKHILKRSLLEIVQEINSQASQEVLAIASENQLVVNGNYLLLTDRGRPRVSNAQSLTLAPAYEALQSRGPVNAIKIIFSKGGNPKHIEALQRYAKSFFGVKTTLEENQSESATTNLVLEVGK
jgi:hypothetical protein